MAHFWPLCSSATSGGNSKKHSKKSGDRCPTKFTSFLLAQVDGHASHNNKRWFHNLCFFLKKKFAQSHGVFGLGNRSILKMR